MQRTKNGWHTCWSDRLVASACVFTGFGVAHLSDDLLAGVPSEFNLSTPTAQMLGLVFFVALSGTIALAARGSRSSYHGLLVIGLLLACADTVRHVPEIAAPGMYRGRWGSGIFSIGLIASGVLTSVLAWLSLKHSAWRQRN